MPSRPSPTRRAQPPLRAIAALLLSAACAVRAHAESNEMGTSDTGAGKDPGAAEQLGVATGAVSGMLGAQSVPITLARAGQVSVGLYTPTGRMVRTLAQLLPLPAGAHTLRWDGMDDWGNLIEPGTALTVKVFHNPGLKAFYEFSVAGAGEQNVPWPGNFAGAGGNRAGGWLGDHSAPGCAALFGDRIFLGSGMAEFGNSVIAVTAADGIKRWGRGGLDGWLGPHLMASDAKAVYAVQQRDLYIIDPADYRTVKAGALPGGRPQALAAHAGTVYAYTQDASKLISPFRLAHEGGQVDPVSCHPEQPNTKGATEFHQGGWSALANTFISGERGDTRARLAWTDAYAYLVVGFKEPVAIGSAMLMRTPEFDRADVLVLAPGRKFEFAQHLPDREQPDFLSDDWIELGKGPLARKLTVFTAAKEPATTQAVMVRLHPRQTGKKGGKANRPDAIRMVRFFARRLAPVAETGRVILPPDATPSPQPLTPADGTACAWDFTAGTPISGVYPCPVIVAFPQPQTFRGLAMLNAINAGIEVEAFSGDGDPTAAADDRWTPLGSLPSKYNRKIGQLSSTIGGNERYLHFPTDVTARALRLKMTRGWPPVKFSGPPGGEDVTRVACGELLLLKTVDHLPEDDRDDSHLIVVRPPSGDPRISIAPGPVAAMAADADGRLHAIIGGRLVALDASGDRARAQPIGDAAFAKPLSLAISRDRIAVGDDARGIVLLDRAGKELRVIGRPGRPRGPWDPTCIERPAGLAFDAAGKLWVAELRFSPKRVARFDQEGRCEAEFFGPPMYGGGGTLDPDLKSFYHRGGEWAIDWEQGTSRLAAMYEKMGHEDGASLETNGFQWTSLERAMRVGGKRYLIGGGGGIVIARKDGPTAIPAVVMGSATGSPFLLGKAVWQKHWAAKDLQRSSFIWCDANGDGRFQVDEVDLFKNAELAIPDLPATPLQGLVAGDFGIWNPAYHWPVREITPAGVPIYRRADIKPVPGRELPVWPRAMSLGGPQSAKPAIEWATAVTSDGYRLREGQPYLVGKDGSFLGGGGPPTPSDYIPRITGAIMNQPLRFVGTERTAGAAGEIGVMNGNNGHWYAVSLRDAILVGAFFTGRAGGFGGRTIARGDDVTDLKHYWETFHGQFLKADDGRYYAVAGKGWHGIHRIEGLDQITASTTTLTVDAKAYAENAKLREVLKKTPDKTLREPGPRAMQVQPLAKRTTGFALDGELADWGSPKRMQILGPIRDQQLVDAAFDERGLYIAYSGWANFGNASIDPRFLFKTGHALELKYRGGAGKGSAIEAGDKRIVFGAHQGSWIAMLYDYVNAEAKEADAVEFSSPWTTTRVARVVQVPADEVRIAWRERTGMERIDELTADGGGRGGAAAAGLDELAQESRKELGSRYIADLAPKKPFAAEVFISWKALGLAEVPAALKADFGILSADTGGSEVEYRTQWADADTDHCSDLGIEAQMHPNAWGTLSFDRPRQ